MPEEPERPSREAEAVLRWADWAPERQVDATEWIERLRGDGNSIFPLVEAIMRNYGGIRLEHQARGGRSHQHLEFDPTLWWGQRDHVEFIEELVAASVCPVGEAAGGAMLAVAEDGRVLLEFEGSVIQVGQDWCAALDNLILGRGENVRLAKHSVPLDRPQEP